jgi:hypothetical protein
MNLIDLVLTVFYASSLVRDLWCKSNFYDQSQVLRTHLGETPPKRQEGLSRSTIELFCYLFRRYGTNALAYPVPRQVKLVQTDEIGRK